MPFPGPVLVCLGTQIPHRHSDIIPTPHRSAKQSQVGEGSSARHQGMGGTTKQAAFLSHTHITIPCGIRCPATIVRLEEECDDPYEPLGVGDAGAAAGTGAANGTRRSATAVACSVPPPPPSQTPS
ncbi:hypothetical protein O988_05717 [Pseudogymnoascus sp. VKM F-3808]|nr:hypothetical protein O988_05717 [Pseudogymnoascus sp. VKM F-3808]